MEELNCKIESLKDYINTKDDEFIELCSNIFMFIKDDNYPNSKEWFYNTVVKNIITNERDILFVKDNKNIVGVSCLKNNCDEKRISIFKVDKIYKEISTSLMDESLTVLDTNTPIISVSDERLNSLSPLFKKYNWHCMEILSDYFSNNSCEYVYNGYISDSPLIRSLKKDL